MSPLILLPVSTGVLLGFGQFFMKKFAIGLPPRFELMPVVYAALSSPHLYIFLLLNLVASVTYVASLRLLTMTSTFATVFVAMGATVLALDVMVNRVTLPTITVIGLVLGIVSVLLIAAR